MRKLFLVVALCLITAPAFAASYMNPYIRYGNFYLGAGFGGMLPMENQIQFSGAVRGSGDLKYENGSFISGMAGFQMTEFLALEGEFGYSELEYEEINGKLTGGSLGFGSGKMGVSGQSSIFLGMANAIISPLGRNGFSPYFGAGAGLASTETDLDSLSFNGFTKVVNAKESKTSMALSGIAGLDYVLGYQLSIGGRYRYLWIDSAAAFKGNGVTTSTEDLKSHVVSVQATYRF